MKKLIILLFISLLFSCSGTPTPKGLLYTKTRGPFQVTSNGGISKMGKASVVSIAGLFVHGDASINRACEKGGITKIHHVDYEDYTIILGLYQKYTVIVYGE